jgi:hypothetical protein
MRSGRSPPMEQSADHAASPSMMGRGHSPKAPRTHLVYAHGDAGNAGFSSSERDAEGDGRGAVRSVCRVERHRTLDRVTAPTAGMKARIAFPTATWRERAPIAHARGLADDLCGLLRPCRRTRRRDGPLASVPRKTSPRCDRMRSRAGGVSEYLAELAPARAKLGRGPARAVRWRYSPARSCSR